MEEVSFRALPALETRVYDGWVLRMANGYTRRANSVNPVYGSSLDVREKIALCEAIYNESETRLVFKMTDAVHPADLDATLNAHGFIKEAPTSVQTLDLAEYDPQLNAEVFVDDALSKAWLADFARLNAVADHHVSTLRQILERIEPKTCYAALKSDSETVAVGLGVIDGDFMGLFDIVTDINHRRRGYGRAIMDALLHHGKANGATTAYLQAMTTNDPALSLYEGMGFREAYQYWYRVKPA
jgi:ribosomal protein S18 acetylase RimI-like enzyme